MKIKMWGTRQVYAVLLAVLLPSNPLQADQSPVLQWLGEWQQGALLLGTVPEGFSVEYEGQEINVAEDGHFLIGLGRDAATQQTLKVVAPDGQRQAFTYAVVKRSYDIQKVEGVPQRTVTPPEEQLERIRKESQLVAAARKNSLLRAWYQGGFQAPLEGKITGVYGSQRYYNGEPRSPHYGLDYAAPTGALVYAPAAGAVRLAESDLFYSGGTLILDHGYGLNSSFLHLSEILVAEGSLVERGEPIARVGSTGRATGPHLDWRMNWRDTRIDPALVLKFFPVNQ